MATTRSTSWSKRREKGNAVTDYISAKSFLLVKRWGRDGQETLFSDYRNVDGEMVPFVFVVQGGDMGRIVAQSARGEVQRAYSRIYISPCVKVKA